MKRCKNCKKLLRKEDDEYYSDSYGGRGFCDIPCNLEYLEKEINKLKKSQSTKKKNKGGKNESNKN